MLDFGPPAPKRWTLSRFFTLYKTPGQPPTLESFASRARLSLDETDLALLRSLAARNAQTATELVGASPNLSISEVERRLEALTSIAVVFTQGGAPPVWVSIECASRQSPFVDFVEITNHCPSTCIMCRAAQGYMERPRGFMDRNLFERILAMIGPRPDVKPLILHNAGEPLLHPDLMPMVATAQRAGIPTELSTNAGFLSLDVYHRLRDAGIARIVIALDALDTETLRTVRGAGARPQDAIKNVDAILNYRASCPAESPALVLQMVQMRVNAHQHQLFQERYGRLGLVGVSAFLKRLEAPDMSPLFADGASSPQFFCVAPWQSLGIYWDGRVVPCCYDLNASLCIGDVNRQTLMDIWHDTALSGLRERLKANRCLSHELCAVCRHRPDRYRMPSLTSVPEVPNGWH